MLILLFLFLSLPSTVLAQSGQARLTGQIVDLANGTPLSDCNILVLPTHVGTTTNEQGKFEIQIPYGSYTVEFTHLGHEKVVRQINLSRANPTLNLRIAMSVKIIEMQEVTVIGRPEDMSTAVQKLEHKDIRHIPTLYSDVLRSVKILPGVSSNNELSSSYNVRGGNFDENLIYLNGYEIYRPFLLRQGVEENQTLINPDMVEEIRFYAGAFPASYGDKMSSALVVNYTRDIRPGLGGVARADLFNVGLALHNRIGKWSWLAGVRYTNPDLFVSKLQTSGSYRPLFVDGQLLMNFALSSTSNLELFALNAYNRFNLVPERWAGHFSFARFDIRGVEIEYGGKSLYDFRTGLLGLRYSKWFTNKTRLIVSGARYTTREDEDKNLTGNIFYIPDAREPDQDRQFLKSSTEKADNSLDLQTYEIHSSFQKISSRHHLQAGVNVRFFDLKNNLDELFVETGEESIPETPLIEQASQALDFGSVSGYFQDVMQFGEKWQANLGVRMLRYGYSDETLFSPRVGFYFYPSSTDNFNFRWGIYYQPPFFYEIHQQNINDRPPLKSQKAMHAVLGWDHRFNEKLKLQIEWYYKKLDRLIPFYIDQLKLIYLDENRRQGYAYGVDVLLQGEVVSGVNSWLGYSYLNSKEKELTPGSDYQRRLLDQRHTFRLFLQDKNPRFANIQSHTRILFGSGYLYHPREVMTDDASGQQYLAVDFDALKTFKYYLRIDLGFSASFKLARGREVVLVGEVLNAWNVFNVASYSWVQLFPDNDVLVRIPHVFSRRFINLGVEVNF